MLNVVLLSVVMVSAVGLSVAFFIVTLNADVLGVIMLSAVGLSAAFHL